MSRLTPEQWDRVSRLYNEVRGMPASSRGARIIEGAAGDVLVALEVQAMLHAERPVTLPMNPTTEGPPPERDHSDSRGVVVPAGVAAGDGIEVGGEQVDRQAPTGGSIGDALEAGASPSLIGAALEAALQANHEATAYAFDESLDDRLPPGTRVGPFTIIRLIDAGGMGIVYEARQAKPARSVALKVMRLGLPSRSSMRRFEYESEILAYLQHPNIAQVFEAGMHFEASIRAGGQGILYFAMEYIPDALPITAFADKHDPNTRERVELFLQVCDAVQHGHQKGIIHRDLKPSNILVDSAGRVKVIDFGVAKATESDIAATTIATSVGQLIGTVQYMSPEQCSGEWGAVDTRSDVYALGAILYVLLCRVPPYEVSTMSIVLATRAVCEAMVRRPRDIKPDIRGGLEAVVLKAIERDLTRRYANAGELANDLRRWLAGDPVEARDQTVWVRSARWVRRRPLFATTAACLFIVLTVLGGSAFGAWWMGMRPTRLQTVGDPPNQFIQVMAANGNIVHEWRGVQRVVIYDLYRTGDQRGALVWWSTNADDRRQGIFDLYDIRQADRPLATLRNPTRPDDWPVEWLDVLGTDGRGESFNLSFGASPAADIFPELPGDELIIVANHDPQFPSRIAIHDAKGRVVYTRWHAGHISDVIWLPSLRLLVATGARNQLWLDRPTSPDEPSDVRPSRIITAFRPEIGGPTDGLPLWLDGKPLAGVAWYRFLYPRREARIFFRTSVSRRQTAEGEEFARLVLQMEAGEVRSGTRTIILSIDVKTGEILRTVESNEYANVVEQVDERTNVTIPRASVFQLPPYPHGLVYHRRDENSVPRPVEEWPMGAAGPRPFVWSDPATTETNPANDDPVDAGEASVGVAEVGAVEADTAGR